eukprot:s865_g5.t1
MSALLDLRPFPEMPWLGPKKTLAQPRESPHHGPAPQQARFPSGPPKTAGNESRRPGLGDEEAAHRAWWNDESNIIQLSSGWEILSSLAPHDGNMDTHASLARSKPLDS